MAPGGFAWCLLINLGVMPDDDEAVSLLQGVDLPLVESMDLISPDHGKDDLTPCIHLAR